MSVFKRLFQKRAQKEQAQAAHDERYEVEKRLSAIYDGNFSEFLDKRSDSHALMMSLAFTKPSRDVIGLFCLGAIMEIVSNCPRLPTPPYDRAYIHLINFFTDDQTTWAKAQNRAVTVKEQFESLDKYTAYLVSLGREAANDSESFDYILKCYAAAERYSQLGI